VTEQISGQTGDAYRFPVDESKVLEFARAVREVHADADAPVVPPTFPAFAASAYETLDVLSAAGLDLKRVLHGEQEYVYERPLRPGDRLVCETTVTSDTTRQGRRGGRMRVLVLETAMRDEATGSLVVTARATVIELPEVSP
jgi:acyl dehydratase